MAFNSSSSHRPSYSLTLQPVNCSLTAGTMIPAPPASPPDSPQSGSNSFVRPPTPHGGPLSSHPTCPSDWEGIALPPTPEADKENIPRITTGQTIGKRQREPSVFKMPTTAASATSTSTSNEPRRRPSTVRKLLSLTNLRTSFSNSSRTSFSYSPESATAPTMNETTRFSSPSTSSIAKSFTGSTITPNPSVIPQPTATIQGPVLRHHRRKSSSWFTKRKSSLFALTGENNSLGAVHEDSSSRPDTRDSKRIKVLSPAPSLPELKEQGDDHWGNGEIGWQEEQFK